MTVPRPAVLVAGSLHHDIMVEADRLPARDETAVGRRWYPKFGGKGGNQAVACARAGVTARMLGAVGEDAFGVALRAGLIAGGVDDRFVRTLPDAGSGMSVAIQDASGDYAATIVSGANLLILPAWADEPALWQDVGLLVLQNEVPGAVNLAAARAARARGLVTLWNAAPARAPDAGLAQLVDVLIVNAVEAEMMGAGPVGDLESAARAARALRQAAPATAVIVTAGARGLAAETADGTAFRIPAQKVTVVSSHGAGDAFIGALAAGLLSGESLPVACARASDAAARHVAGKGGSPA